MTNASTVHGGSLALAFFLIFFVFTAAVTLWASRSTHSTNEFFTTAGRVTAWQNGLAMSGEYLSASALLGMAGLISLVGYRGYIYSIGAIISWPVILFLLAGPMRRLGTYTLADVIAYRLRGKPVRVTAACASIPITLFYLIGQLVAGGSLVKLLFGMPYASGVIIVGVIMLGYVLIGGMLATTWVQLSKAILMYGGTLVLTFLLLRHFHFNLVALFSMAATKGGGVVVLQPGGAHSPAAQWDMFSLAIALLFGAIGMPQTMTRFLTVPNVRAARMSAFYATCMVATFHLMILLLGFGAMALVGHAVIASAGGGGNMAVPLLSRLLGGNAFFGYICGVSFATVLAVVAGLTLASATTFAHDAWAVVGVRGTRNERGEMTAARMAAAAMSVAAVALALLFENTNIAVVISLALTMAASTTTPALLLSLFWKHLTTAGAVAGMVSGTISTLAFIGVSPMVLTGTFHLSTASVTHLWWSFPLNNPTIITLPLAFASAILVSLAWPEQASQAKFNAMNQILRDAETKETDASTAGLAQAFDA